MNGNYNHRIIASTNADGGQRLAICEVWYDDLGEITGHNEPMPIDALTFVELQEMLESMQEALALPVLHESEFDDERVVVVSLFVVEGDAAAFG